MKAIVFNQPGGPAVLHFEDRPIPRIGVNEVLIKTRAAGVNRPDAIQRNGKYPAPQGIVQDILGLDVSGTVVEVGSAVKQWKKGDEMMALVAGGAYAEYVVADAGSCLPVPKNISLEDAASLPEVLFTVWHNVFQRGKLTKGEDVLIYGGSGGIGAMAIQLASLFEANAFTLASTEEKVQFCKELGAQKVINYKTQQIADVLGTESVDLILDSLGGNYLDINLDLLRPDGRLIYINAMEGERPSFDIKKMMRKRLHITGSTLRTRSYAFKKELAQEIYQKAFPLLEDNQFKSLVRYRFPASKAREAHELLDSRDFFGKIILTF